MFFTQEDYRKIEAWLAERAIKDTDFPLANSLKGNDRLPILQDSLNKIININDFIKEVSKFQLLDFVNVSTETNKYNITLQEAISLVPIEQRKLGLAITFYDDKCNWLIYQFKGTSVNQWNSINCWNNILQQVIDSVSTFPDEEDVTGVSKNGKTIIKFKDKPYEPKNFSNIPIYTLRRNLVGTEACAVDDEDHVKNILTQDMIKHPKSVYIIKYDFDLNGKVINIPSESTLVFQGGTINNGTVHFDRTGIQGTIYEINDIGNNLNRIGDCRPGQLMTFRDNQDVLTLKWWSGTEWKTICES